jgi:predicted TIM-barrel fold metal-dependent hydrolase
MTMFTRRELLMGAAVAGATTLTRLVMPAEAGASQPSTPVNFAVPKGACDSHTHIFGDPARFPLASSRAYTPELASIPEMRELHRALHTERVVIVNPSIYGADNSCSLDAIKQLGRGARGVAVIDDKTPNSALDEMYSGGMRAIRINLETAGQFDPAFSRRSFQTAIERVKNSKWHVQLYTRLSVIEAIKDQVAAAPVPVVFDHFGGAQGALGVGQPGFGTLLNLVRTGKAYVKVSAPYRSSMRAPSYPDVAPLAKALVAANPERILWGSDWPHPQQIAGRKITDVTPLYQIDDGRVFNLFAEWVPDAAQRKTILVDTPAKLFGY